MNRFRSTTLPLTVTTVQLDHHCNRGDPREWFEIVTEEFRSLRISGTSATSNLLGAVKSVTSNTITLFDDASTTPTASQTINILPSPNLPYSSTLTNGRPVVAIPIKHMFDLTPPAFQNGAARSVGTASNPAEVQAHIVANAFMSSSPTSVGGLENRDVDAVGGKEVGDVYSVAISTGVEGFKSFLTITQKTDVLFGALEGTISHNIPPIAGFEVTGFTGGRAGKKVKSAGDKAQDLLGIVANSQNFQPNSSTQSPFSQAAVEFAEALRSYEATEKGDYILGIQIPYDSSITSITEEKEQRNFFITHGKSKTTYDKSAAANPYSASDVFSPTQNGSRTKGIKAIITDLQLEHQAQSNVYNFRLQMIASDFIL